MTVRIARFLSAGAFALTAPALLVAASGPAGAATKAELQAAFASADKNADGYVDVDEYVAHAVEMFAAFDTDRDERLHIGDIPGADAKTFARIDADGDGTVSLGEAVGERMQVFFEVDENRDGKLSLDEVLAAEDRF